MEYSPRFIVQKFLWKYYVELATSKNKYPDYGEFKCATKELQTTKLRCIDFIEYDNWLIIKLNYFDNSVDNITLRFYDIPDENLVKLINQTNNN